MRKIFLVTGTLILVGCSFTVAALAGESAKQGALLQLAEWGGGYGGTQNNSGSGYGGQQGGGGWSGQQQQTPQGGYGGQQQNQGGYKGGQQQNEGGYNGQPQGDYQGQQQQQGGNSGQQQQGGTGGQQPSGGSQQTGNGGDKTACVADCNKQCMNDFVPGSTKQKNCSGRCGRICR